MNILFFDIDGTLADGLKVPESAKRAIAAARKNDDLVIICTGRPVTYVKKNFSQYADGYICLNGRYGEVNGEKVYSFVLKNNNLEAEILNYGGIITKLIYKGTDVVLGRNNLEEYLEILQDLLINT